MKILVIGGGGREHTLVWKISQNPKLEKIYCAPGNAGIAGQAECVKLDLTNNEEIVNFAEEKKIDLTVIGPEDPLAKGIVDEFEKRNLPVFGPNSQGAQIESSKSFAKNLLKKYKIPTGEAEIFTQREPALDYLKDLTPPLVVKADGLAAGKGVIITETKEKAEKAIDACLVDKAFGEAGNKILIEEYLEGEEVSFFGLTDGKIILPMVLAQDFKRVFDEDKGPNTGGMGSYSPVPFVDDQLHQEMVSRIAQATIEAMSKEGITYKGVLYGGLIITSDGPKVLEFNCRFGDPENQVVIPRLQSDLLEAMLAVVEGRLHQIRLEWDERVCVDVVLASQGYPGKYETGFPISGLDEAERIEGINIFHAGTAKSNGKIVTSGGRVLNISSLAEDFKKSREKAYEAISQINFEGMHFRKDIALKVVKK